MSSKSATVALTLSPDALYDGFSSGQILRRRDQRIMLQCAKEGPNRPNRRYFFHSPARSRPLSSDKVTVVVVKSPGVVEKGGEEGTSGGK